MIPAQSPAPASRVRIEFLDVIRFLAMVFMVQGHTLDALVRTDLLDISTFPWSHWYALRGLTAPTFLMVSGAAGMLSLQRDPEGRVPQTRLLRRLAWAFGLLGLGYLLVFPASRLADLRWLSPEVWRAFLQVNILQLNGAGLLLLTGLAALTRSDRAFASWSLGIGLALTALAPLVQAVDWFRLLPEVLAAYLSHSHGSLFPLFPHGAYLFLGSALGYVIKAGTREDASRRFRRACGLGAAVAAGVVILLHELAWIPLPDPFGVSPAFTMMRLALVLLLMAGVAYGVQHTPALAARLVPFGRRSLHVYVGHLMLLYGLPWTTGICNGRYHTLNLGQGYLAVLLVGGLTFGGVALLNLIHARATRLGTVLRYSSAALLAWALLY